MKIDKFKSQLKLVLWNCGGWKNKQAVMSVRLRDKGIDVFIVTKIKTKKEDIVKVNGYDIIYNSREWGKERGDGVLIEIKKGIS